MGAYIFNPPAQMLSFKPEATSRARLCYPCSGSALSVRRSVKTKTSMTNVEVKTQEAAAHTHSLEQPQPRLLQVTPIRFTKIIHLIRHGEGFHNVAGRKNHDNYKSWDFEDAHLTAEGWAQAHTLGEHIAQSRIRPQLVAVSPLTRAIETAVGCFGDHGALKRAAAAGDGNGNGGGGNGNGGNGGSSGENGNASGAAVGDGEGLLMVELSEVAGRRAAHAAVALGDAPPFLCMELCREHLGVHPCDRRLALSAKQAIFPGIDFSQLDSDEDHLWKPDHRETKEEIQARGRLFMAQLMARPEHEIAVVTHSSFVHYCLTNYGHSASTVVQGDLHRWFENAELRTVVVTDPGSLEHPADPTHFPGFASHVVEGPEV